VKCSGRHISTVFLDGVRPVADGRVSMAVSVSVTVDISLLMRLR
jgi:hypothetical protein